ncbi:MAG: biotin/lipoyl-binding protein [Deltaproteobacteria bacterium]|nr:biotin/lipoyl-binding protein [Deltaproteobacteria bacterium]
MTKYAVQINGKSIEATLLDRNGSHITFSVNGERYEVDVNPILLERASAGAQAVVIQPTVSAAKAVSADTVTAPMPGIIVQVPVKVGDAVQAGQTVVIMEAMKMENNVTAARSGKVKEILVKTGEEVSNHQALIKFE